MDAFLNRTKYDSFLGREALHLRAWLPMNIRAFIAAVEYHYQIPAYVKASGDPRLIGVLEGIVEAYAGERGFMGTHRCETSPVFRALKVSLPTDLISRQSLWLLGSSCKNRAKRDQRKCGIS